MAHPRPQERRTARLCLRPVPYQRVSMQEARTAKAAMDRKMAFGRPLVVRYACGKFFADVKDRGRGAFDRENSCPSGGAPGQASRVSKIAAIRNKLKALEQEGCCAKKSRKTETISSGHGDDMPLDDKEGMK